MLSLLRLPALVALIATLPILSRAHTWLEELQAIGPNGSYIGDRGYLRGYVARTDPTFDGDATVLWLLPALDARMQDDTVRLRINSSDYLCHPSQRTSNYSNPAYPKLKVSPGGYVAMKYLENGHVTLPWNQGGKPLQGGTVFVYGTTKPSTSEKIADVLQWNAKGTGGDKRGWLMTAQTYDDGRCHQINECVNSAVRQVQFPLKVTGQLDSPQQEQWCETDLKIPKNQQLGDLTLYWVWQWPTEANAECIYPEGKDEYYTSCMDVEIVDGGRGDLKIINEVATNTLLQEDFQTAAVPTYTARTALTASPTYILDDWRKIIGSTAVANPTFTSSCVSILSSIAAAAGQIPPSCPVGLYATGDLFASVSSSIMLGPKTQIALVIGAAPTGLVHELIPAAATTQGQEEPVGPAPTQSVTAPPGGTETVRSTFIYTTTVTKVVTATGSPPPPGPPPAGTSQPGSPHRAHRPAHTGGHLHFNTISTVRRGPTASDTPPEVVGVGPSGVADEHFERHRNHPRRFR